MTTNVWFIWIFLYCCYLEKIIKHYDIQNIRLINGDNRIFKYKRVRNIANYYTTGRVALDFD